MAKSESITGILKAYYGPNEVTGWLIWLSTFLPAYLLYVPARTPMPMHLLHLTRDFHKARPTCCRHIAKASELYDRREYFQ